MAALIGLLMTPLVALGQNVYRCETHGHVSYSDAPCVGAKVIDATPTKGMDQMSGRSVKGKEVRREEFNQLLDEAIRPLTGKSTDEMDVLRRRGTLQPRERRQCEGLDARLPALEAETAGSEGRAKARLEVELYKARKRYFDLKC